ncbi:MAG: hypothetical protein K6F36_01430 [Bacilli bacterium]|nr:hypothetical protein [Bacilli bacterium]
MNFYALKNRFKYGYKKFFAILFGMLGVACEIATFVLYMVFTIREGYVDILVIISYVFVLVAYYYLLSGNIKGTMIAYRGFMIFVFYTLFDFGIFLISNTISSVSLFATGDPLYIGFAVAFLAFSVLAFVSGLMTYIKFRSYQTYGKTTTYETVRNWCLVFTIMAVIANGALIPFYIYGASVRGIALTDALITYVIMFIEPTATIFIAICSYFTILRLRD